MSKMTRADKIAYYKERIAALEAEEAAEAIRENIETGDEIEFEFGRGETKQSLKGVILGQKDDSNGRWVKVQVGEGFDAETKTIRIAAITKNEAAEKRAATPAA